MNVSIQYGWQGHRIKVAILPPVCNDGQASLDVVMSGHANNATQLFGRRGKNVVSSLLYGLIQSTIVDKAIQTGDRWQVKATLRVSVGCWATNPWPWDLKLWPTEIHYLIWVFDNVTPKSLNSHLVRRYVYLITLEGNVLHFNPR